LSPSLLFTVRIWPSVLCQNWFSFMGLGMMGKGADADKPPLRSRRTGAGGLFTAKGIDFSGTREQFRPF
jgi:hypothetical protein